MEKTGRRDVSLSIYRLKAEPPERGCYLSGGSRLGKRCHWFLSAATSRTDTTEAAAMSQQPGGSLNPRLSRAQSHTLQKLCSAPQASCPPPATVQVKIVQWAEPSVVGVSFKANKKSEQRSCAAIGQSGHVPAEVWPETRGGVVQSSASLGPTVSDRGFLPPACRLSSLSFGFGLENLPCDLYH